MKKILITLAAALVLASCLDVNPILYRCMIMGYVKPDGTVKGDDGRIYTFSSLEADWRAGDRVLLLMDVSEQVNDSVYKASSVTYSYPLYKKPVVVENAPVPDSLGTDPIQLINAWYAGGCLNVSAGIQLVPENGTHAINLLIDRTGDPSDTVSLALRHRSDYEPQSSDILSDYSFYASFPLRSYLPEKDSVILKISWVWDDKPYSTAAKVER